VGAVGITDSSAKEVDLELEVMESLRLCLGKLLQLEGSEWLFRGDNGSDEDLIAAVAAAEKLRWETTDVSHNHQYGIPGKQWIVLHNRPVQSPLLVNSNNESPGRISRCGGDFCIWGRGGLLISFGVWCMHRLLELSLMESRPELWGKYTYVLNRLQVVVVTFCTT
jgi:ethylene-insensitive protein 2